MRISDWSSDVCSSDLAIPGGRSSGRTPPAGACNAGCPASVASIGLTIAGSRGIGAQGLMSRNAAHGRKAADNRPGSRRSGRIPATAGAFALALGLTPAVAPEAAAQSNSGIYINNDVLNSLGPGPEAAHLAPLAPAAPPTPLSP